MATKKITLCLDPKLHEQVKGQSERQGIPITDLLNIILFDYFQNTVQE